MDFPQQRRCGGLAVSSSFCRSVYSEIEEVGWEHLVHLDGDFKFLSFRIIYLSLGMFITNEVYHMARKYLFLTNDHDWFSWRDKKGRAHIMEIRLDRGYPKCQPSVSADVPYLFSTVWTADSRLKDLVDQFQELLEELQDFWSTLDDIDNSLSIVNMKQPSRSISCRQIDLGDDCFITLSIDAKDPRSLPESSCELNETVMAKKLWSVDLRWPVTSIFMFTCVINNKMPYLGGEAGSKDKRFSENLELILEIQLPRPANVQKNDQQDECGICYAEFLPIDGELGSNSGTGTDYRCDNSNCKRTFHSVCLEDWLRSITTTRQSFDVLFGNCPYCSELVAVKINTERR